MSWKTRRKFPNYNANTYDKSLNAISRNAFSHIVYQNRGEIRSKVWGQPRGPKCSANFIAVFLI